MNDAIGPRRHLRRGPDMPDRLRADCGAGYDYPSSIALTDDIHQVNCPLCRQGYMIPDQAPPMEENPGEYQGDQDHIWAAAELHVAENPTHTCHTYRSGDMIATSCVSDDCGWWEEQ